MVDAQGHGEAHTAIRFVHKIGRCPRNRQADGNMGRPAHVQFGLGIAGRGQALLRGGRGDALAAGKHRPPAHRRTFFEQNVAFIRRHRRRRRRLTRRDRFAHPADVLRRAVSESVAVRKQREIGFGTDVEGVLIGRARPGEAETSTEIIGDRSISIGKQKIGDAAAFASRLPSGDKRV